MSLSSFPHQYRGSNASKLKVRSLAEVICTLLIRSGVKKNPGALKCPFCSKTLARSTKKPKQKSVTSADDFISNAVVKTYRPSMRNDHFSDVRGV